MNHQENEVWKFLEEISDKKGITEIMINDYDRVFAQRDGRFIHLNNQFLEKDLLDFISDVKKFNHAFDENVQSPIFDGLLPDGSRINIIGPPFAAKCPAVSIRRYLKRHMNFDENGPSFALTPQWGIFFKALVAAKKNIIVAGGTGVGKTTFMNMLLEQIPLSERLLLIEDVYELSVKLPNCVRLQTGMDRQQLGRLIEKSLGMRPDRLVIGEIRGAELFHFISAMNTGHEGSFTTVHANSAQEVLRRLESLYLLSGHEIPLSAIRRQISTSIDFIIFLDQTPGDHTHKQKRFVKQVIEVSGMDGDQVTTGQIGVYDSKSEALAFTGLVPQCLQELSSAYPDLPLTFFKHK